MNQNIIRPVYVDVDMRRIGKIINTRATFNQRDVKTAVIICRLKMDEVIDLTNCTVSADILKPDNTNVVTMCRVVDAKKGVVAIGLNKQCLISIGDIKCELSVQSDDQVLYSPVLLYKVSDNLFDLNDVDITSQDEYPILNQLISEVESLEVIINALETLIQSNETIRESSENLRIANEDIRVSNENERIKYINAIEIQLNEMFDIFDNKVETVNVTMNDIISLVSEKIDNINSKLEEIDLVINKSKDEMDVIHDTFTNKISLIDSKITIINQSINSMETKTNAAITNMINETNTTIGNIRVEIDDVLASISIVIDDKLKQVSDSLLNVSNIMTNITKSEKDRETAEIERTNTFNKMVSDINTTSADIDDIMSMIGGL